MKKRNIKLTAVLLVGLICCSCTPNQRRSPFHENAPIIPPQDTEVYPQEEPNIVEPDTDLPPIPAPTPEAPTEDETVVYPLTDFEIIDTFDKSQYSVFAVTQANGSNLYGVIDIYGGIHLNAIYDSLGWCDWHEVLWGNKGIPDTINYPIYIDDEYRLDDLCGHGGGRSWGYVLDTKNNTMYSLSSSEGGANVYEVNTLPAYTPYVRYTGAYPIVFDYEFYNHLPNTYADPSDYEYYDEFAFANYESFLYSLPDSEFEWEFRTGSNETIKLGICSAWYSDFANDYLVISRGGKYGFVDKNGNDASQFIYEAAEEAYDGKAWVKLDGKWRVIKLR
ncbi:MAG: WG repeat-containing protein [Ruminococcaceae bacterium]|nr:WG repeat-containing protein [Oscillospiraceae bacterium]